MKSLAFSIVSRIPGKVVTKAFPQDALYSVSLINTAHILLLGEPQGHAGKNKKQKTCLCQAWKFKMNYTSP